MAKAKVVPAEGQVKARVLSECAYGVVNDVVALDAATAQVGVKDGVLDTDPAAVAYAEGINPPTEE